MMLNYAPLVPAGQIVATLTLGIAADDLQFPDFGQPFSATLNGCTAAALTTQLNSLNPSGPQFQIFTMGLAPSLDTSAHILPLSIDEGGDGGDGWAIDFLTVGVTTRVAPGVPEPASCGLLLVPAVLLLGRHRHQTPGLPKP
jgi:hypothetical protein